MLRMASEVVGKGAPWQLAALREPAEGVVALLALVVVEHIGVDRFANGRAGSTTGCTAEQCADERAGQATKDRADGTCDHAKRGTGFGASECSGSATSSTSGGAHDAARLAGVVARCDVGGGTAGT